MRLLCHCDHRVDSLADFEEAIDGWTNARKSLDHFVCCEARYQLEKSRPQASPSTDAVQCGCIVRCDISLGREWKSQG